MLLEKIPLAEIARGLQISESCLQQYLNAYYATVPQQVQVPPRPQRRLTVQMDELWSFMDDKGNEQWIWLALDVDKSRRQAHLYLVEPTGLTGAVLEQAEITV